MVDHRIAPKGDMKLFWDRANWQPYRRDCNSRKNILHEGGFGRASR
jgi:5-methylcytosine-specific restriction protein A